MSDSTVEVNAPSYTVEVDAPDKHTVIVQGEELVIEALRTGPQGPPGPAGVNGFGSGSAFYFTQDYNSSSDWVVNHGLGFRPNIAVLVAGSTVTADITHTSAVSATIHFNSPQSGTVVAS